ncbi:hypothetical protein ACHAXA_010288 [Cyclostephanos tholiformis]|uniref:Thioredoxin domain-containing protein n=1 Tax=Cyclostephanos tholiformis TaxID=382380 RepID=A0ABD3RFA7_9STRA
MFRPMLASCRFLVLLFIISPLSSLLRDAIAWTIPPSKPPMRSWTTEAATGVVSSRDDFLRVVASGIFIPPVAVVAAAALVVDPRPSIAAPPFAVMSEEMGYFPINDQVLNATVMVPASIKRESTQQAISLARYLQSSGAIMYGAFWCPHCRRQRELFGREAFKYLNYVECDPRGYKSRYATCALDGVEGYPSWKFGNGEVRGGEMELSEIAMTSGYLKSRGRFDSRLETGVPPLGGASCR